MKAAGPRRLKPLDGFRARRTLCVLNTDNVPFNGDAIRSYVCSCDFTQAVERRAFASEGGRVVRLAEFEAWLKDQVGENC